MSHRRGISRTLIGELVILLVAAPPIYFPNWFPFWAPYLGVAVLAGGWVWRRRRMGRWWASTPVDWPLWLLFLVMLPMSVLVAPAPLRELYSIPRALILLWNFSLFSTVVVHASTRRSSLRLLTYGFLAGGIAIAALAPLGMNWTNKFPVLDTIVAAIPTPLRGRFGGAEEGFNPNQTAGALLYVLPLLYAFVIWAPMQRRWRPTWWLLIVLTVGMTGVLILAQSRGALLGFAIGLAVMLLLNWRWGRWTLLAAMVALSLTIPLWFNSVMALVGGLEIAGTSVSEGTIAARQEIWIRAIYGIQDFSITGMGLGTFRSVVNLLYPIFSIPPDIDIGHAHNFFLQTGLDFGVPGLVALLSIYLAAIVQLVLLFRQGSEPKNDLPFATSWRTWSLGITGSLVAQTLFSQQENVSMGSKPNFLFWYLMALTFAVANLAVRYEQGAFQRRRVRRGEHAMNQPAVAPRPIPDSSADIVGQPVLAAAPTMQVSHAPATPAAEHPVPRRRHRSQRKQQVRKRYFVVGVGVALLALLLLYTVRLGVVGWQTLQTTRQLRAQAALFDTDPAGAVAALRRDLPQLADNLAALDQTLTPVAPLLGLLGGLPGYGPLLAAAPELVTIGGDGVGVAQDVLNAAATGAAFTDLATLLAQVGPKLPDLAGQVASIEGRLAQIDAAAMPAPFDTLLQQGVSLVKLAQVGMQLGPQVPWLLGMDEPRHYIVLVQNNHELRATGGFISAVGLLTLEDGKVANLDFADSYEFYRRGGQYPLAPEPMKEYMGIQLMLLRDANWWSDLPTSAQMARKLYGEHTGIYPDGVITVDLNAVKHLIGALGTLQVPGSADAITVDNVEEQLIRFWDQPLDDGEGPPPSFEGNIGEWFAARKDFIPNMAEAALQRIQAGTVSLPALATAAQSALDDRSVQVWLDDASAAAVLADAAWDGALLSPAAGDFLAVVDTNMGYNKVNAVMERSVDYRVAWDDNPEQGALATLTLVYTHPGPAGDPNCDPTPRYGENYADMIARCYFDYVRVYAPDGSRLLAVEGVDPETVTIAQDEAGRNEFAAYFVMPTAETKTVTFTYRLPAALTAENYQLTVQRQAGTGPLPLRVTVGGEQDEVMMTGNQLEWTNGALVRGEDDQ